MDDFEFKATKYEYNLINTLGCARASMLVSKDSAFIKQKVTGWGFNRFEDFTRYQHFGIAIGNAKMVLISFRERMNEQIGGPTLTSFPSDHLWVGFTAVL